LIFSSFNKLTVANLGLIDLIQKRLEICHFIDHSIFQKINEAVSRDETA